MKLERYNFKFPENLIAEYPAENRDEARMMVLNRKEQTIEHKTFKDIVNYFDEDDLMILNNTRVFPVRLYGNKEKTGAAIEVFLLRELDKDQRLWDVIVEPARKIRIGNKLYFGEDEMLIAEVIDNTTSRGRTVRFLFDENYEDFEEKIRILGKVPLPEYINRKPDESDVDRYQTIYAKVDGAIIPPSAGFHFSKHVIKRMEINGVDFTSVTLHIGLEEYHTIEVEDLSKHKTTSEEYIINEKAAGIVNSKIEKKKRICAVGLSTLKALESSLTSQNKLMDSAGWTHKFIYPPYNFSIANALVTGFHMPKSTLYATVCAFGGLKFVKKAYEEAIKEGYKFCVYGDAMLII